MVMDYRVREFMEGMSKERDSKVMLCNLVLLRDIIQAFGKPWN